MKKLKSLHFIVEGKWLQDFARRRFWFEDAETHGYKILKEGLMEITDEQVTSILNGDSYLTGHSICNDKDCEQCKGLHQIQMVDVPDDEFKTEITKRKLWLNEHCFKIGQHHIEKNKIYEFIDAVEMSIRDENEIFADNREKAVELLRKSFFTSGGHRYPSPSYIPEKGSHEYDYVKTINDFLTTLEKKIKQQYPNFSRSEFLKPYRVIQEELEIKIKPKIQRTEGCVLFIVPHPERKYEMVGFNVSKEYLLVFIKEREHGERSMKFTLSLDIDKEKALKRYENLWKNIAYAHKELMHSLGLEHSETGVYPDSIVEYYLNEAIIWYVYQVTIHNDYKPIEKLANEVKLQLPKNHGYGIMSIDGKVVDEYHDLR